MHTPDMLIKIPANSIIQVLIGIILPCAFCISVYYTFRFKKAITNLKKKNTSLNAEITLVKELHVEEENKELYKSFLENNRNSIINIDFAGNIILINKAAKESFATDKKVRTIFDLFPENICNTLLSKSQETELTKYQVAGFSVKQNEQEYWYWSVLQPYFSDSGEIQGIHITLQDFTERKNTEKELYKILKNQEFLVNFSNYLNSTINIERKIDNVLNILGKYLNIDRIYIFRDMANGKLATNIHEWCIDGIATEKMLHQNVPYNAYMPGWKKILVKDGIICKHDFETLPKNLPELLLHRNTKSILVLPLYLDSDFFGFIGFDFCRDYHFWEEIEIGFLKTISITLSNAFERNKNNIELQQSEEKFKDLFNNSSDAILIYNITGDILEVNDVACSLTGYNKEALYRMHFENIISKNQKDKFAELITQSGNESKIIESEFLNNKGELIPVEINFRSICLNKKNAIISVVRNITERKEHERAILRVIMDTEEKERGRIARDLHDGLGPLLSGIKLYVKVLGMSSDDKKKENMVQTTNSVVDEAMTLIKEITNNLSPHVLIDFGLATAIQSFCKRISITKAINIKFDSNLYEHRLPPETELVYFRVLKELVNNTLKHAFAKNIQIYLLKTDQTLTMIYSDDGVGFDTEKVMNCPDGGMGIANITKRIESIGGNVSIQSKNESGIHVKVEITL